MEASETIKNFNSKEKSISILKKALALFSQDHLFLSHTGDTYISFATSGFKKNLNIQSSDFKSIVIYLYNEAYKEPLKSNHVKEVIQYYYAQCKVKGEKHRLHNRMAYFEDNIYIDLGHEDWKILRINKDKIDFPVNVPVKFTRYNGMRQLPKPDLERANLNKLKDYLNFNSEEEWALYLAFILQCYYKGPYVFINLVGTKGTAKTWTTSVIRNIVDPRIDESRNMPSGKREIAIQAQNQFLLSFDNISKISSGVSDFLCRLSSGGGHSERSLYTNDEEKIFSEKRPLLVNGINNNIFKPDLADRFINIYLSKIKNRIPESELKLDFNESLPKILGGLYKCLQEMLKSDVDLEDLPRMADAIKFVSRAEKTLGYNFGFFLKVFKNNQLSAERDLASLNPLIVAIEKFLTSRSRGTFEGQASTLLNALNDTHDYELLKSPFWPKAANHLVRRLNEYQSLLYNIGIEYTPANQTSGSSSKKIIKLELINKEAVTDVNSIVLPLF